MKFFKYRTCDRSHGWSKWDYIEDWDAYNADYYLREQHENEGFRGLEIEEIEHPPKEWLESEIIRKKNSIDCLVDDVTRYTNLLQSIK